MKLNAAKSYAIEILRAISPCCERVEIVGSIRRRCPDVGDIEFLAIPKIVKEQSPFAADGAGLLFEQSAEKNLLYEWAMSEREIWIKPGTKEIIPWLPKPDGKYWRAFLYGSIKLDLFIANRENWGILKVIRTGHRDFSRAVVTHAAKIGMPCDGGYLTDGANRIPTYEESDVFDRLGLVWVAPEKRHGWGSLIVKRGVAV